MAAQKSKDAILGAFVADAATMPLHWIYDRDQLKSIIGDKIAAPEFFDPPSCPFYNSEKNPGCYALGDQSCYGAEAMVLLRYLVKNGGVDPQGFTDDLYAFGKSYKGYVNKATRELVARMDEGHRTYPASIDDAQANSFPKVVLVTARYGGKPELAARVEEAVRAHQNSDLNVALSQAMAAMLDKVLHGADVQAAFNAVHGSLPAGEVKEAMGLVRASADKGQSTADMLAPFGKFATSCSLPNAFYAAMHIVLTSSSYIDGVRANILLGGDNCSRSAFVGGVLGAVHGVPANLVSRTQHAKEVEQGADKIVACCGC